MRWLPILVAALVVPLVLMPTLDVFQSRLSAYGGGEDDVGLVVNRIQNEVGMEVANALLTTGTAQDLARTGDAVVYLAVGVERGYGQGELDTLEDLARDGATVLVFDDFGGTSELLDRLGVRRVPGPVVSTVEGQRHVQATIDGVDVRLRSPAALELVEGAQATVLGRTDEATAIDSNDDGTVDADEPVGPFTVAVDAPRGNGRIVLVSDVTLLTNRVVSQDPSGADLLVHLVSDAVPAGASAVLVIDEGRHVRGLAEVPTSIARGLRAPLSSPWVLAAVTLLVLGGTAVAAWRTADQRLPEHDPGLDRPGWDVDTRLEADDQGVDASS